MPEQKSYNLEEAQEEAQKMQEKIEKGEAKDYEEVEKLVEEERLKEIVSTEEHKWAIINCLSQGLIADALKIKEGFNLPEAVVREAAKQGMINRAVGKRGSIDEALKIRDEFGLSETEIQTAVKEIISVNISRLSFGRALEAKEKFNLSEKEARAAAKEGLTALLSRGETYHAPKVKEKFNLSEKEARAAAKEGMIHCLSEGYIDAFFEIRALFKPPEAQKEFQDAAKQGMIKNLREGSLHNVFKIKKEFELILTGEKFTEAINEAIRGQKIMPILIHLDEFPRSTLEPLEKEYFLLSYQKDLNIPAIGIYQKYIELKKQGDEMQLAGYIEKIKQQTESLISSQKQSPEITEMENYQELVEDIYPNQAENWTNFENNESCPDRSDDLKSFKIRDKYEVDLSEGVEMVLKPGQEKDEKALSELEKPISEIQQKFAQVGFEKKKMFEILDQEIEQKIAKLPHQEIYKTREEKLYGLLLESLANRFNPDDLKEILIGYQFAEYEDIKTYLEGTRAQAEQAKNPEYAYLLELREFFADRIKEVQRKVAQKAQENPEIMKILPEYYQAKRNQELAKSQKEQISRLRPEEIGLEGNLLERLLKELSRKTDKKGLQFKLVEADEEGSPLLDEKGHLIHGKKAEAIAGIISAEQRKAAKAIETVTGEKTDPENIHLGELNLKELLKVEQAVREGQYDEELFSRYLLQAFQGVFEKELTTIDKEVAKYELKEAEKRGKKTRKLECFITKNHTSAHARGVGGVCVSGDNPGKQGEECQWNMPNYFQLVLRDSETKVCQGLVLLHYYEEKGKKILTGVFDPCSTYLYQIDEKQLFKGLLKQLEIFSQDNDIDIIAVSQNQSMRTNRAGGEFERAMENQIRNINQTFSLSQERVFSYNPRYTQKNLDMVWAKKT